jgi:hypothetical protein
MRKEKAVIFFFYFFTQLLDMAAQLAGDMAYME